MGSNDRGYYLNSALNRGVPQKHAFEYARKMVKANHGCVPLEDGVLGRVQGFMKDIESHWDETRYGINLVLGYLNSVLDSSLSTTTEAEAQRQPPSQLFREGSSLLLGSGQEPVDNKQIVSGMVKNEPGA